MHEDTTVSRVLVASLHQAIAEVLPARLEHYERWLAPGPGGTPPDVTSFTDMRVHLLEEGDASDLVFTTAGQHAAVRAFRQLPAARRAWLRVLPRRIRAGKVVRLAVAMLPALYPATRVDMTRRGGTVFINIDGSPFCDTGRPAAQPSCSFYSAALAAFLRQFDLRAAVRVSRCRTSGSKSCLLMVLPDQARRTAAGEHPVPGLEPEPVASPMEPLPVDATVATEAAPADAGAPGPAPPTPSLAPSGLALVVRGHQAVLEARWNALPAPPPLPPAPLPLRMGEGPPPGAAVPDQDPETPWHRL